MCTGVLLLLTRQNCFLCTQHVAVAGFLEELCQPPHRILYGPVLLHKVGGQPILPAGRKQHQAACQALSG